MARYYIDFIMSLYQQRVVEADSPEEAKEKAEKLLDKDGVWYDLLEDWDDPAMTDWIRDNVEVEVVRECDPDWNTDELLIGEE